MPVVFVSDDDKLALKDIVVPVVKRNPGADLRGALVDIGGQYGALRQAGWSHGDALAKCQDVAEAWVRNERVDLPIRHLGDEEILSVARGAERIPTADDGGLVDIGCQVRQRWQAGYTWDRALFEAGGWLVHWYGGDNPWQMSVPVSNYPALVGRLRIENNLFVDDTGPVLPLFAHAGDLFALWKRDRSRANDEARKVKAAGYHGTRTWAILGGSYWERPDRHIAPKYFGDYYDLLREWLRDMHATGLRVMLSMGDIGQLGGMNERLDFARRLVQIARDVDGTGHIIAFLDGGNEAWQTGEPDPVRLAQFVREYRNAGGTALLTLTSPPGEEPHELDKFSIDPADCYDVHGYRDGRFFDKRRHIFSIPYEGKPKKKLGVQSEPAGSGDLVSVTSNKHELNHEAVATLGLQSLIARQAWVWFSGEGVRIQAGLDTEQGFEATPRICAVLPRDIMGFHVLHHSGDTWSQYRIVDQGVAHESRVDGAQHADGRCVYIFDGTPGAHTFRAARNFSGMLYNPGTGEGEPFSKRRGEVFTMSWDRGRLFVGRVE